MYKPIAKQLDLDERQTRQLRLELEQESWLYSTSIVKRALAMWGYAFIGSLMVTVPFVLLAILFPFVVVALQ